MIKHENITYEFRPDHILEGEIMRLEDGVFIPDDGKYGLAFKQKGQPIVAYVSIPHKDNLQWSWCENMRWTDYIKGHPHGNAWHYMAYQGKTTGESWRSRDKHPNTIAGDIAMNLCSKEHRCANGRGVDFYINDTTILAGLLRNAETKEIIMPPDMFNCIYCGNIDWRKKELLPDYHQSMIREHGNEKDEFNL